MRNYQVDYSKYTFKPEDDWGCYENNEYRKPWFDKLGYSKSTYKCDDGKFHHLSEHTAKWEYFYGKIPEGMEIDHKKPIRNGGTNKLSNLRLVNHKENMNNETTIDNFKKSKEIISDETRKKWSEMRKGKIPKANPPKIVYQYTLEGKLVKKWESVAEASRNTGFSASHISHCCNGGFFSKKRGKWVNVNKYKGFKWSYNYE